MIPKDVKDKKRGIQYDQAFDCTVALSKYLIRFDVNAAAKVGPNGERTRPGSLTQVEVIGARFISEEALLTANEIARLVVFYG